MQKPSKAPFLALRTRSRMDSYLLHIAVTVSLLLLTKLLLSFFFHGKKRHPTSPPSLPIIGHFHLLRGAMHLCLSRLSDRYGPVILFRFGTRPIFVVSSPSLAEECFTKNDLTFANRPRFPSTMYLSGNFTTVSTSNYGPHWRNLRRIANVVALSSHGLNSFADARAFEVGELAGRLFQESNPDGYFTKVELKSTWYELALKILMRIIAGEWSADSMEATKFMESVGEMSMLNGKLSIGDVVPLLSWMDIDGMRKKTMRLAACMDELLQKLIDERRKSGGQEKSMIRDLLSMQKTDPENYTDQIIKSLIISLLEAGIDTSAATIEWAMTLLLNNPEKLAKAQAEIDQQIDHRTLIQESDLSNLPYLQCIISETLRLHPAAPLLVPHESSEECAVGGYDVPRGTMLLVNAYKIQRDPETWPEPTVFEPERFRNTAGKGSKMFPFGTGRRRCPGEGLANRVTGLVLGTMMQCFDWKRVGEDPIDTGEESQVIVSKAVPLEAMYRPRAAMEAVLSNI